MNHPRCCMPGCIGSRWPNSVLCNRHWRRMTMDERRALMTLMNVVAAAAIAGEQESLEAALREVDAMFQALAPELMNRAETPLTRERLSPSSAAAPVAETPDGDRA